MPRLLPVRRLLSAAMSTITLSLAAACSPAVLLGSMQERARGGEILDVAYAPGPRHGMDIYLPAPAPSPPPVVVFFYGGGWTGGDRAMYRFAGRGLAACGVMTFIPDYAVWPQARFPRFLEDGAQAVAMARNEARRLGGDTSRLFLMGHSAGAYIAAMLALDPSWLRRAGVDPRGATAGMIGISGPYDFLPLNDPVLEAIFDPAGPETQPITYAANATAPLLLLTGAADTRVRPANTLRLAARVRQFGGRAETIVYPGLGHVGAIGALASPLRSLAPVRTDVCRFMGVPERMAARQPSIEWTPAR